MISIVFSLATCFVVPDQPVAALKATLCEENVPERLPLVLRLEFSNPLDEVLEVEFLPERGYLIGEWARIRAINRDGAVYELSYKSGLTLCGVYMTLKRVLAPSSFIRGDYIQPLVYEKRATRQEPQSWQFLPPGRYRAVVIVSGASPDRTYTSNEFEFEVVAATGEAAEAAKLIDIRHVGYMNGKDNPGTLDYYSGENSGRRGLEYFRDIQQIIDRYPNTPYGQWLSFWKLWYHGDRDERLRYAREHKDFLLSDELMLQAAWGAYVDEQNPEKARSLVDELVRTFPNGSANAEALRLKEEQFRSNE